MSLLHLAQRLQVKRDYIPPIGFIDDLDPRAERNIKHTKKTQKNLTVKSFGYRKKLDRMREKYVANRQEIIFKTREYNKANPGKVKCWRNDFMMRHPGYQKEWRLKNLEKMREYSRERKKKIRAETPIEERKKEYQIFKEKMVKKYGLEGWRKICAERSKKSRQKKKLKQAAA